MTTQRQYQETWAENAIVEIATLADEEIADWIIENRWRLHDCERFAPLARRRVQQAIEARDTEVRNERIRQGVG